MNPCAAVRESCARVMQNARYVRIDEGAVKVFAAQTDASMQLKIKGVTWDSAGWHYCADASAAGPLTCQYVFVLDALNWCFWPTEGLEYDNLATALKVVLEADGAAFSGARLASLTLPQLMAWFPSHTLPEPEERLLRLQELGAALEANFAGLAENMVKAAAGSAVRLVSLVLQHLPGFRDATIYQGRLVHFYKRAQILVGDVWAAYGKQLESVEVVGVTTPSPYCFSDIGELTMFADYRVPQLLRHFGVLEYDEELAALVDARLELSCGSPEEVEIRAATVLAVEQLRQTLLDRGVSLLTIEVDWLLWQMGEESKERIKPHHRTRTIFY